jgi:hypothetical protein
MQLGAGTSLSGRSDNATWTELMSNAYRATDGSWKYITTAAASEYLQDGGGHSWYIAPSGTAGNAITFTQAMTLDSSGNLLVGTTSVFAVGKISDYFAGNSQRGITLNDTDNNTASNYITFYKNGTQVGTIQGNGGTGISYTSSSDYRLKYDVKPLQNALSRVLALNPCEYKWKETEKNWEGFIAHELQAVVPQCVIGEKDAVDEDGNPKYQGIDTSFLVATLTAAIQEQQALIQDLTTRLAKLEDK